MATLTPSPSYPVPGREVASVFALEQAGANFLRVWCTIAPDGSELDKSIKEAASSSARVVVYEGDAGPDHPWRNKFDKGGTYTFVCQEYAKGTGFSGGYQDDTRANNELIKKGGEVSRTLDIGVRHTNTLGTGSDTAQLIFYVFGATIRGTSIAVQGIATPAVINPSSPKAKTAALTANVATAIAALAGVAVTTALGTVSSVVSDFRSKFNSHIALTGGSVHANADSDNFLDPEPCAPPTPANLSAFITYATRLLKQHETNDSGTGSGSATAPYHFLAGANVGDSLNQPIVRGASGPEDSYAALGALWVAYEGHRVSLAVHGAADNTNTLSTLPKLLDVHRYFFASLASTSPTAAPGEPTGSALLKAWGIKDS